MSDNSSTDFKLFGKKTLSELFEDIYNNSANTKLQINKLLVDLAPLIVDPSSARLLVPVLKEYLEVGVKNDDQLVKLAQIAQKIIQGENKVSTSEHAFGLSATEKDTMINSVNYDFERIKKESDELQKAINKINPKDSN